MEKKKSQNRATEKQAKSGRPFSGITQKPITFRCDNENVEFMKNRPNWGRWLNELIAKARQQSQEEGDCAEMPPELDDELK